MEYYKVDPGGNITAICKGDALNRAQVAKKILQANASIERVGFWTKPNNPINLARLEMMGGEFCGNAARCLGYLLSQKTDKTKFSIEVSGLPQAIEVEVKNGIVSIKLPTKYFSKGKVGENDIVTLPGIKHVFIKTPLTKSKAQRIINKYGLQKEVAIGVVYIMNKNSTSYIKPFVWVRKTKTLFEETSCASASMCLAYLNYSATGNKNLSVKQPSNKTLAMKCDDINIKLSGKIYSVELDKLD